MINRTAKCLTSVISTTSRIFPHSAPLPPFVPIPVEESYEVDQFDPLANHPELDDEPPCQLQSPKKLSTKEQYQLADELSNIRTEGCAPVKRALSLLLNTLQDRSQLKTSLSDCNVTLFNFHSTKFAERLLQKNVGGLVLVESGHGYSRQAKDFARFQRKEHHQPVTAYRAELGSLLGIGRKKLLRLPSQLLGEQPTVRPLDFVTRDASDESGSTADRGAPILINALPISSQQTSAIDALTKNILLHHTRLDNDTIYKYGAVEMLTFLDIGHLSHLACAVDHRLSFMAHSHRRQSAMFNKLFRMTVLSNGRDGQQGFDRDSFDPAIPSQPKSIPHEKKLAELSLSSSRHYAVSIRPQLSISLAGRPLDEADFEGNCVDRSALLGYSLWCQLIGRHPQSKKTATVLNSLVPESASAALSLVDGSQPVGDVPDDVMESLFMASRDELAHQTVYRKYCESLQVKRDL